jgi:hypothetical protein
MSTETNSEYPQGTTVYYVEWSNMNLDYFTFDTADFDEAVEFYSEKLIAAVEERDTQLVGMWKEVA